MNFKILFFTLILLCSSVNAFSTNIETADDKCKELISNAFMSYYNGNFLEAINYLEVGIEQFPECKDFYIMRGIWYEKEGYYEKAIEYYSEGIELFDSFIIYWHRLLLYDKLNKKKEAYADWDKIKRLNLDTDPVEFAMRVDLYIHYSDYKKALSEINKLLSMDKSASRFMIRSRIYYETKKYNQALNDALKAAKNRSKSEMFFLVSDYLWISMIYYKMGDLKKSHNYIRRAISVQKFNSENEKKRGRKKKILLPVNPYLGSLKNINVTELTRYGDSTELDGKFSDKNKKLIEEIIDNAIRKSEQENNHN